METVSIFKSQLQKHYFLLQLRKLTQEVYSDPKNRNKDAISWLGREGGVGRAQETEYIIANDFEKCNLSQEV